MLLYIIRNSDLTVFVSYPTGEYAKCSLVLSDTGRYVHSDGNKYNIEGFEFITKQEFENAEME